MELINLYKAQAEQSLGLYKQTVNDLILWVLLACCVTGEHCDPLAIIAHHR